NLILIISFFFLNTHTTTQFYTLSLHDALPISLAQLVEQRFCKAKVLGSSPRGGLRAKRESHLNKPTSWLVVGREQRSHVFQQKKDRKSTRLNSSHRTISYAVFCLKKKTN